MTEESGTKPTSTQVKHSWRATLRTAVQTFIGFAALSPALYSAITHKDPASATGFAAAALAVSAGITRIMAIPAVEDFISKYLPWLAAQPK